MKRTNVVKLAVDEETREKLKELGVITAKCWNEVNWLRMQQFKKGEKVDFAKSEKEVYEKYKHALNVNAQEQLLARDRGNGLKTSLVYRWTNGAGWVKNI
jgi:putative transposase